jgi:branched-chain amino acid transport system ATP-binding protein
VPLLSTSDVTVRFGGVTALNSVSLDADAGTVTGLIGPNGAGKTTFFNVVSGIQAPTTGQVFLDGRDVTALPVYRRARLDLARTFQRLEIFTSLTVRENIQVAAEMYRRQPGDRVDVAEQTEQLLEMVGLRAYANDAADTLSTGLARMVELARALAARPRLLLLDEPGSGLDSTESRVFGRLLVDLAADGLGILLVEHDMELIMDVCQRIHVLDFGVHLMSGRPEEVRSNPEVQRAYLGTAELEAAP